MSKKVYIVGSVSETERRLRQGKGRRRKENMAKRKKKRDTT